MMNLPHLTFLRSFEAAARYLSFTNAAEELNCTQSAVSNHVRSLEGFIGRPLFVRYPRSLSLTEVGSAYLPSVRHALLEIDLATQSLLSQTHKREVVVSCPFSLAENWLPEIIGSFKVMHSDIDLTVHGTVWTDVEQNVSDISITINHVDDVTADMARLWEDKLTVVCAPDYTIDGQVITRLEQLFDAELIHVLGRQEFWELIAKQLDLPDLNLKGGLRTNASNLALELAAKKLGCVAVPRSLVLPDIERGILVEPFDLDVVSPWSYFIKDLKKNTASAVSLFHDWLMKSATDQVI